jgi:hypothetical protein
MKKEILAYIESLAGQRKSWFLDVLSTLETILVFPLELGMQYNMPSFYVSLAHYPKGYHVGKNVPLPYVAFASHKHYISIYFMPWMVQENDATRLNDQYEQQTGKKLNAGKVCLRFKKTEDIPMDWLISLVQSVTVDDWIQRYEQSLTLYRKSQKI